MILVCFRVPNTAGTNANKKEISVLVGQVVPGNHKR